MNHDQIAKNLRPKEDPTAGWSLATEIDKRHDRFHLQFLSFCLTHNASMY